MHVKTWIVGLLAVVTAASLAACKPISLKTDGATEAVAQAVYSDIAHGNVAAIQARLTPDAAKSVTPAQILSLRQYAETVPPTQQRLIAMQASANTGGLHVRQLTYELTYPGRSVLYAVTLKRSGTADWRLESATIRRATEAELAKGRFTLTGRSPLQWLFLTATVASPLLMLSALIAVVRAPGLKRKWLWGLLALLGIGTASMNWTTGQATFYPIMLNLIGAGVAKQGFSGFFPWILKFTVPVGAVIAHWRAATARGAARTAPAGS